MPPTDVSFGTERGSAPRHVQGSAPVHTADHGDVFSPESEDTLELRLPEDFLVRFRDTEPPGSPTSSGDSARGPLLDDIARWGSTSTAAGAFQLVPVRLDRDLTLISRWMNDPAVAAFWELAGPDSVTAAHLRAQLDGDGRSVPCLGLLDGIPLGYFEIYRADLDPLARHYPARPHDTGIHLLIGGVADRGRGIGSSLLGAVADLVLDKRPRCTRVIAEPDLRNTPSIAAFLSGGYRYSAELDLPGRRVALMVRDRTLRNVL
ncbi:GNAT family N-acetyltransferase [Streptomyces sp. NPDC051018]|uniref:GNAT family N-acetyltransferase n=1 Tax=Streptomyces sp. NPDC051018 TaxID=3365639 RepID=UPI0037BE183D